MSDPFPYKNSVHVEASPEINVCWTAQKNLQPKLPCSIPPEFGGCKEGYSPEDFFAFAVINCIIGLFKVYCEKRELSFKKITGNITATLDIDQSTQLSSITHVELTFHIEGAIDKDKIKETLENAIKNCPISNSIKSGKTYHIEII